MNSIYIEEDLRESEGGEGKKGEMIIKGVEEIIGVLIGVAYITLGERKIMGSMQRRVGPGVIGIYGLIQPLVDGGKLLIKELREPQQAERGIYIIDPRASPKERERGICMYVCMYVFMYR
jgi:hypothetical protein